MDTGVWLHIAAGRDVTEILGINRFPSRDEIIASPITVAELTSVLVRQGKGKQVDPTLGALRRAAVIHRFTEKQFELAGRIHADERTRSPDLSLADSLILAQAKDSGALLVTTDAAIGRNRQRVRTRVID